MTELKLDPEQSKAVNSDDSMFCIAGPGSGKTRVLTEKARRILNSNKSLICLTFTKSAAREMGERVPMLPATTIHSLSCGYVGWKDSWGYTGLLYRFLKFPFKPRYDWVLIDEVQDLNELELDLVLSLVGDKIFAVGDPYQSIYGFQGAMGAKVMSRLQRAGCKEHSLHSNYRSCEQIVAGLNKIYNRSLVSCGLKVTGLTAVLVRTNDDLFFLSKFLAARQIPHILRMSQEISEGAREKEVLGPSELRLMTIHCSKGLEFDNVILYGWFPNILSADGEEVRVYYVAASRASHKFMSTMNSWEVVALLKKLGLPRESSTGSAP